jgi:hypothetical protein
VSDWCTAFGLVTDQDGLVWNPELRKRAWATPAAAVASVQNERIPIDVEHSHVAVGELVDLQRTKAGLWGIGHVRARALSPFVRVRVAGETRDIPVELYWSAERIGSEQDGILLTGLSVTSSPATTAPRPLTILPGKLDHRGCTRRWSGLSQFERELLERAAADHLARRRDEPLYVHEEERVPVLERSHRGLFHEGELVGTTLPRQREDDYDDFDYWASLGRPPGRIRWRPAGRILSVS